MDEFSQLNIFSTLKFMLWALIVSPQETKTKTKKQRTFPKLTEDIKLQILVDERELQGNPLAVHFNARYF